MALRSESTREFCGRPLVLTTLALGSRHKGTVPFCKEVIHGVSLHEVLNRFPLANDVAFVRFSEISPLQKGGDTIVVAHMCCGWQDCFARVASTDMLTQCSTARIQTDLKHFVKPVPKNRESAQRSLKEYPEHFDV